MASRARPSQHPGLCARCQGAGVSARALTGWVYCPDCHGHGVVA